MNNPSPSKKTYTISFSTIAKAVMCSMRLKYMVVDGIEPAVSSIGTTDLLFGNVWHLFRKEMYHSRGDLMHSMKMAMDLWAKDSPKAKIRKKELGYITTSWITNQLAIHGTVNMHGYQTGGDVCGLRVLMANGKPVVEEKFSIPLHQSDAFDLHLTGVFDELGYIGNCLAVSDDKTTSFNWQEKYFESYEHSAQMLLYVNVVRLVQRMFPDSPIGKAGPIQGASILGLFHTSAGIKTVRSPFYDYSDVMLERNANALTQLIADFVRHIENEDYQCTGLVTNACKGYGDDNCPYLPMCTSHDDDTAVKLFRTQYKKKEIRS